MIVLGLSTLAIGLILFGLVRKEFVLAYKSRRWPQTMGWISAKVERSGLTSDLATDGTMAPTSREWREITPSYSYVIDGEKYTSSRFDFSSAGWWSNSQYYDDDEPVTVYYNPSDPSIAVFHRGLRGYLFTGPGLIGLGILFLALAF